jgi:hypothetical protein
VIDRLVWSWVTEQVLRSRGWSRAAHQARGMLAEQASLYDRLAVELSTGRCRLPEQR